MEISRWCKPPVCYEGEFQALKGRWKWRAVIPSPFQGSLHLCGVTGGLRHRLISDSPPG